LIFFAYQLLTGCSSNVDQSDANSTELIVFAAASLTEAFIELADQFEFENPGVTVILNFAGSQQLAHQLSQGAPADVFASANHRQMNAAIETGRISDRSPQSFAGNKLVIVYPPDNPANLHSLTDLAKPGLSLVLAAQQVPAGQYAQAFLEAAAQNEAFGPSFYDGVLENIVSYEENVRAVLSKVTLGEADAGVVYISDIVGGIPDKVGHLDIPEEINMIADYPIATIDNSKEPELAQQFIQFVQSPAGQGILGEYGFLPGGTPS
jgi:molybdate transport system substrate-binding protein